MATFAYKCRDCGHRTEEDAPWGQPPVPPYCFSCWERTGANTPMGRDFQVEQAQLPGAKLREEHLGENPEEFKRHLRKEAKDRRAAQSEDYRSYAGRRKTL